VPGLKILLDTHLLLWWLMDARRLSRKARELVQDPSHTIFLSVASLWEIRIKEALGKVEVPENFDEAVAMETFEVLPIYAAHTKALKSLPMHHRDPFDRMLIVQAMTERLQLLTADEGLAVYGSMIRTV